MHIIRAHKSQCGAALIVGLILMLVASVVAMSSMRGSTIQEGMTANLNNKAISFMAAEAGATAFWQWFSTGPINWNEASWRSGWQTTIPTTASSDASTGGHGYFWIDPTEVVWGADIVTVTVQGLSRPSADQSVAATRIALTLTRPVAGGVNQAFRAGVLSDQDITINGNSTWFGSFHANGDFSSNGASTLNDRVAYDEDGNPVTIVSIISAHGTVSTHHSTGTPATRLSNAAYVEVPSAADYIDNNRNNAEVINSCTIPSGNRNGEAYFCDGNATTSGNFSNVTIMATGNVTHNGAAQLGGDAGATLTVAIIAGGNITVNGSNDTYGVFWADGTVTQNGSSVLGGSIVAGGNITRNGAFNYVQHDDFGNLALPTGPGMGPSITSWSEEIP